MQTEIPKPTNLTRGLFVAATLGAIGIGILAIGTPFATWTCQQSARTVCGRNAKATAIYPGNALSGTCAVRCE